MELMESSFVILDDLYTLTVIAACSVDEAIAKFNRLYPQKVLRVYSLVKDFS